jgi:hypothetical protein
MLLGSPLTPNCFPMKLLGVGACLLIVVVACDDPTTSPSVYHLSLHEDHTQVYYCPGGNGGDLYCRTDVAADQTFTGTLTVNGSNAQLMLDKMWLGTANGSSISLSISGQCGSISMTLTTQSNSVSGTWTEISDCHGLTSGGTLTGTR